jgi:hypothetical protein
VVNAAPGSSTSSFLLFSVYAVSAFDKMALSGITQRLSRTSVDENNINEKPESIDVEGGGERQQPRRMSRIAKPASVIDDSSDISVGALIDAEKDHAIKYRTCSWQKVR